MNRQKVESELNAARTALHTAQARYRKAVEDMDVVIAAEAQAQKQRDAAADIKAYQQSEARKREGL